MDIFFLNWSRLKDRSLNTVGTVNNGKLCCLSTYFLKCKLDISLVPASVSADSIRKSSDCEEKPCWNVKCVVDRISKKLKTPLCRTIIQRDSVTRWIFFWRFKHFNQYFLSMRWWFLRSFKSFSLPYTIINFLFASLKILTNFENAYCNPPQNFLLCDWSMFSSADLSLAAGKMRENKLVTGGFRYYFYRITGGFL